LTGLAEQYQEGLAVVDYRVGFAWSMATADAQRAETDEESDDGERERELPSPGGLRALV
jgi:hypothetical protein